MAAEMLDRTPVALEIRSDRVIAPDGATVPLAAIAAEFDRIGKSRRPRGLPRPDRPLPSRNVAGIRPPLRHRRARRGGRGGPAHGRGAGPPHDRQPRRRPRGQSAGCGGADRGAMIAGVGMPLMEEVIPGHTRVCRLLSARGRSVPSTEVDPGGNAQPVRPARRQGPRRGRPCCPPRRRSSMRSPARSGAPRYCPCSAGTGIPATPERVLRAIRHA